MIVVRPISVTDARLTSTTIPEPDTGEAEWSAGTYNTGDEVIKSSTHRKYRVVADPSTTTEPGTDAGADDWADIGPTNAWAMFDDINGTQSTGSSPLEVVIDPGELFNSIAGFNINGASEINVTVDDPTAGEVYNETIQMRDNSAVNGWYDYFFEPIIEQTRFILTDIPAYPQAMFTVTATGGGDIDFGTLLFGRQTEIGVTLYGTSWQGLDFSRKERDEFGNFVITPRRTADLLDYDCYVDKPLFGYVKNQLKSLTTTPTLWIGDESDINDGTAVYGYYRDAQINISSPQVIDMTIQVEGLT